MFLYDWKWKLLGLVQLFANYMDCSLQTPLSMEFRQEYWSGELFPSTGDLPNPEVNCSLPDSSVHGILQARILEWVAYPFSRGSSQPRNWTGVSHIAGRKFTSWTTGEAQWLMKLKSFHVLISCLNIFFREMSVQVLWLFFNWSFVICWVIRVPVYSGF